MCISQAEWIRVTNKADFSPRDTSEDFVFDGRMWLSNAYHEGNVLVRDLWASGDGIAWTQVSENTPYDGYSEMVVFKDRIWAIKGSVWSSRDGLEWTQVAEKTPFGVRGYGEVVVHDGKMWQLGSGQDVWWSEDGASWTCATAEAPYGPRYATAVAAFEGKLWVLAGSLDKASDPPEKHYPKFTTHNDVWCSRDGKEWTRVMEHAPWDQRMWSVAKVYKDRLWIIGGFDNVHGANLGDVWMTRDGVSWEELKSSGETWSPRHEPTCYVFQDSLWVVAGNAWPLMNDVWRINEPGPEGPSSAPHP